MISLQAEELTDAALIQLGADDAQAAHDVGSAVADIQLAGDEVEVDPLTVAACHDALGAQNDAVLAGIQLLQNGADLLSGVLLCSLAAPGGEDLVGVVVMMVMVVAAAGAVITMLVVVMMLMVMVMVVAAAAMLIMLVMMVMLLLGGFHVLFQGVLALESGDELLTGQILPGSGDDGGVGVVLADQLSRQRSRS